MSPDLKLIKMHCPLIQSLKLIVTYFFFIKVDDSNGTMYVNLAGYDVPNVYTLGNNTSQTP